MEFGQVTKYSSICFPCACMRSRVQLFVTLQTVACQASLSMGFSRQEYWSILRNPPLPGDPLDPGIEPASLLSPALAGGFFTTLCHLGSPYFNDN